MSGCYRCGLSEGSDSRLCETCYRSRFHRGLLVTDAPCPEATGAIEFTPRTQAIVLSGGALAYIGIVSFVVTCFGHFSGVTAETSQYEFYSPSPKATLGETKSIESYNLEILSSAQSGVTGTAQINDVS
jgi:hypothetical protein